MMKGSIVRYSVVVMLHLMDRMDSRAEGSICLNHRSLFYLVIISCKGEMMIASAIGSGID